MLRRYYHPKANNKIFLISLHHLQFRFASSTSEQQKPTPQKQKEKEEELELAKLNAKYIHPNVIPGRPDMALVDWQDVELDKKEAEISGEEIYKKRAERRHKEQSAVLENQLRSGRFARIRDWLMMIVSMLMILVIVPKFVGAFRVMMEKRNQKDEIGPVQKPEDYDDATGKSESLDAVFPRRLNYAMKPGGSLAGSLESTNSVFTNKQSAFQTGKFK